MQINTEDLIDINAAAKKTALSEAAIRSRIWRGEVPSVPIAGCRFLTRDVAEKLAEQYPLGHDQIALL